MIRRPGTSGSWIFVRFPDVSPLDRLKHKEEMQKSCKVQSYPQVQVKNWERNVLQPSRIPIPMLSVWLHNLRPLWSKRDLVVIPLHPMNRCVVCFEARFVYQKNVKFQWKSPNSSKSKKSPEKSPGFARNLGSCPLQFDRISFFKEVPEVHLMCNLPGENTNTQKSCVFWIFGVILLLHPRRLT